MSMSSSEFKFVMLSLSLSSCHLTFVISFSHPHCHDHRGCHHKKSHKSSLSKSDSNVRKQTRVHLILSISISRPSLLDAFLTQPHLHRQSFSQNKERLHNKIQNSKDQNKQTPTIITTTTMIVEPTQEQHHNQWYDPYHLHHHDPAYPRAIL